MWLHGYPPYDTLLYISGEHSKKLLDTEKDKVLGQIGDCENKLSTFKLRLEQLDSSKTNTISLLSEQTHEVFPDSR